jgi:hypothetical protein
MAGTPKTARLIRLAGTNANVRLSVADREFLKDLSKVQLISSDLADKNHYSHLKGASVRSLDRLEKAGLISSKTLYQAKAAPIKTYQFADRSIAGAYGGKLPVTGAKRTDLHELMSSRAYFELGRPATFKLASDFSKAEIAACGSMRPDAIYTDAATGEMVLVEADSGHYNQSQINAKVARWRAAGLTRQVWAQPQHAMADEIQDKLAQRIEARRKAARLETEAGPAAPVVAATDATVAQDQEQFPSETASKPNETTPEIAKAINAIVSGANPLVVARLLSAVLATGMKRRELIEKIHKSEGWLSKRLGLLNAPKDIQRLIEAGQLSESEYYDNRQNVKAGMRGRGESLQYQRMPTVTINIEAAHAIASILKDLAEQQGAAPIRLDANTSKKDITSILNLRAGELRGIKK